MIAQVARLEVERRDGFYGQLNRHKIAPLTLFACISNLQRGTPFPSSHVS